MPKYLMNVELLQLLTIFVLNVWLPEYSCWIFSAICSRKSIGIIGYNDDIFVPIIFLPTMWL